MKDPFVHIRAMELLAELYELTNDKGKALETKKQVDAYRDSVMTVNHSLEIADWQQKYDEERWEEKSQRKMMEMAGIITAIVLALAIGVWWYRRRVKELGFQLDENARRMTENLAEIERLQQSGEASEQTIAELNRQIEASRQRISNKLLVGTRWFVRMQHKECIADITPEERQSLIDYFALLRPKRWQEWELPDSVHRADEFLVGTDGMSRHQIKYQCDGRQNGWPQRLEFNGSPRLVAHGLAHDEETHIPSDNQQGVEGTEQGLHLPVVIDEDGVCTEGGRRQQDGHQRPRVEMVMPQGVGIPEVIDLSHC